jgi:hypothetical protein
VRRIICRIGITAAAALVAACAQPAPQVQLLPPGPTPAEVVDYAVAQAQYRAAQASGNGDIVMRAGNTFSSISEEILSRQEPELYDARMVCERYRVAGTHDPPDVRSTLEPRFFRDCEFVERRCNDAMSAIRRDLEVRIATADLTILAQVAPRRP